MSANLISAPEPAYPKLARLIHLKGSVILQAVVSREGKVLTTHVLEGHRLLRGAASNAVRQWRYQPYLLNGQPEDVATIVTVNFRP
jgi:protein TonB